MQAGMLWFTYTHLRVLFQALLFAASFPIAARFHIGNTMHVLPEGVSGDAVAEDIHAKPVRLE
jgi:hypothetical protein